MSEFRTGKQIAPDHIVTAHQDAAYLLHEVHALTGRLHSLQSYADPLRDEAVAAVVERDEARESLTPWKLAAALGWVIALVEWVAR